MLEAWNTFQAAKQIVLEQRKIMASFFFNIATCACAVLIGIYIAKIGIKIVFVVLTNMWCDDPNVTCSRSFAEAWHRFITPVEQLRLEIVQQQSSQKLSEMDANLAERKARKHPFI